MSSVAKINLQSTAHAPTPTVVSTVLASGLLTKLAFSFADPQPLFYVSRKFRELSIEIAKNQIGEITRLGLPDVRSYQRFLKFADLISTLDAMTSLTDLDLSSAVSEDFIDIMQSAVAGQLRYITNVSGDRWMVDRSLALIAKTCITLQGIEFVRCPQISGRGLVHILSGCSGLLDLRLRNTLLGLQDFNAMAPYTIRLTALDLTRTIVCDQSLLVLARNCINLKKLNLSYACDLLTQKGIAAALKHLPKLLLLDLSYVKNVNVAALQKLKPELHIKIR